jgi:nicotinamidase/pyrazinamidase
MAASDTALLVIDMQNDFVLPTGSLSVNGATAIVPIVNSLIPKFSLVVWTQDWHPPDHISFVTNHPGRNVYDVVEVGYSQVLFPAHCVANTPGAEIEKNLNVQAKDVVIKKGTQSKVDSYSCFFDVVKSYSTNAHKELQERKITTLYVAGVATDYCVKWSVLDALELGYKVVVIEDGIAAVDPNCGGGAIAEMKSKGAVFLPSSAVTF